MTIAPAPLESGRDFLGYGRDKPAPRWPGDARVAVSFVVNFEEGAEFSVADGDDHNETIYEVQHRIEDLPDLCLDSHFEYGARAGWWRVMDVLATHEVRATVSACGRAVERLPALARDAIARGHEVAAHGWRWESHAGMSEDVERQRIARTVSAIAEAAGVRPVGWHTRSASSPNTRRLLLEEGGFLYDSDAYNDDLPHALVTGERRHIVLPYAFDTNDMQFLNTNRFGGAADFADYVLEAFDWLYREGASAPKMMSVGLHLRIIGRPGRIGALDRILAAMRARSGVWIARRDDIARHWLALDAKER
ncbi:MAG: polysaccharide deacetylase family protein [Roseiarcus sp.]